VERKSGKGCTVRRTGPQDLGLAVAAAALIREASREYDIAVRSEELLRSKISTGRAVVALCAEELVGFAYYSEWEGGRFLSHSGLVVSPDMRGEGLARALKTALLETSRERHPNATVMSLTNTTEVIALNSSLGFRPVSFDEMTQDEGFWQGCETCRNWIEIQSSGEKCCCQGMILTPDNHPKKTNSE
jgi:GNAT superfamily N-acetyltransferase